MGDRLGRIQGLAAADADHDVEALLGNDGLQAVDLGIAAFAAENLLGAADGTRQARGDAF